jgi:hypothetical protein
MLTFELVATLIAELSLEQVKVNQPVVTDLLKQSLKNDSIKGLGNSSFGGLVVSLLASDTFGGLVVSMLASDTFGGLVVSMLASGTFGGLVVSMLASGTFGGLVVSMLASGTQVRGFKPGRNRRIFGRKNPRHNFLQGGSKAVGPMSQFCDM